jgi:hypothetical protein
MSREGWFLIGACAVGMHAMSRASDFLAQIKPLDWIFHRLTYSYFLVVAFIAFLLFHLITALYQLVHFLYCNCQNPEFIIHHVDVAGVFSRKLVTKGILRGDWGLV